MSNSKKENGTVKTAGGSGVELRSWLDEIRSLEEKLIRLKHELVVRAATPSDEPEHDDDATFLIMRSSNRSFAAPLAYVEEVVQMVDVEALPERAWGVAGLVDYHGEMVAAINLSELVGMDATPINAEQAMVICNIDPLRFAVVVEEATDVVTVKPSEIQIAEEVLPGALKATGVIRVEKKPAIVLDMWSIAITAQMGNENKK